jgi:two-component system phosphate regulon sensor histidine kinase PhoR
LIGLFSVWTYQRSDLDATAMLGLLLYLGLNLVLIPLLPRTSPASRRHLVIVLYVIDLLFASFLIYHTGGLVSQLYLLYCLLIFKAAIYYPYVHPIIFVPFLIFPLYIFTLYLSTGTLVFLQDRLFVSRYSLFLLVILAGMYTAWHLDSRHRQTRDLLGQLEAEHLRITERRRELRAVLDSIGDGVIVVDPGLRLLMINPVAADFFNLAYPQPTGNRVDAIIDNSALMTLLRHTLDDTADNDALISGEIGTLPVSSGKPIICQALATALASGQNTPHGAVVVLRDMTRQKELEESKTNFISMLSHELRTPLTAIRGFVDLILTGSTGELTAEQREYLVIVFDQSEHLQNLINSLLEFAEIEAAETSLDLDLVSPEKLAYNVLGQIEPLAKHRTVTLDVRVSPNLAPLYIDEHRMERVMLNLLDNAVKFSPKHGTVTLTIRDRDFDVLVCVSDSGSGVPRAERGRIFDRFYQVDSSTTRAHGGTGMGLALCKHIVEMHQGQIWVEQPDKVEGGERNNGPGSRFCFTLPRNLKQRIRLAEQPVLDVNGTDTQRL